MIGDFEDYLRRAEEMLADPERTDPARLALADQRLPEIRKHWDELVEISRPLLHKGMGAVDFVDFLMTGLASTGVPVEDVAALLAVGVLRSYETARRRFCGAEGSAGRLRCVLPPHAGTHHVGVDADDQLVRLEGEVMSNPWDRPERVNQLVQDMDNLAYGLNIGAVELTDEQAFQVLVAAGRLAGRASNDLPDWPVAGDG